MQLTDEEKRMLDGDFGAGVQKAMRMLVKVGELFGAEKMVPISSIQHIPLEPKDWLAEMIQDGTKVRTFTGTHSYYFDPKSWKAMGINDKCAREEEFAIKRHDELYRVMDIIPLYTCTPYNVGNVPKLAAHFVHCVPWLRRTSASLSLPMICSALYSFFFILYPLYLFSVLF